MFPLSKLDGYTGFYSSVNATGIYIFNIVLAGNLSNLLPILRTEPLSRYFYPSEDRTVVDFFVPSECQTYF